MNGILKCFAASLFVIIALAATVIKSYAVPAFARQTGQACTSCHFQHYPALNAFGRAFKAGGYTMVGGQGLIEGDFLSLPSTLNASLVTKIRYQKTSGKDTEAEPTNGSEGTNRGELQFPDEAALLIGGRAGENIGFLLEFATFGKTGKFDSDPDSKSYQQSDFSLFASFKMPVIFDVAGTKVGVIPFTTDVLGVSYGFELFNTGAVRNIRSLEHGTQTSAQKFIGTDGAAEGFAFIAANDMGFINYSLWGPAHGATDFSPFMSYLRVAATPNVGGWDLGIGGQLWSGTGKHSATERVHADAWALDAQAQVDVGLPLGVYLTYGNAKKSKAGDISNMFNSSSAKDKNAWSVLGELGLIPNRATVALGYLSGNTGSASNNRQNSITLGATYQLVQNARLEINHSYAFGSYYRISTNDEEKTGRNLTTLMIFAAF